VDTAWLADWSVNCRAILNSLVSDPRFIAGIGTASFYKRDMPEEVRVGWPGKGDRYKILAVIRCEGTKAVRLRLNIPPTDAIEISGGLFILPPPDPHAAPNRADCILTSTVIPPIVFEVINQATIFTM
jgi:hypothetical protein